MNRNDLLQMRFNVRQVQKWISVKDRLPDETGRYLAVKKELLRMSWVEAEQIL